MTDHRTDHLVPTQGEIWYGKRPLTIGPMLGQRRLPTIGVLVGSRNINSN